MQLKDMKKILDETRSEISKKQMEEADRKAPGKDSEEKPEPTVNPSAELMELTNGTVDVIVDNTEHLLRLLEENELDFSVVEGFFDKTRFDSILLRREPFVGICRKDHPFAGREVTMEELLQQTIIHREAGSGTRAILEQELRGYNESLQRFQRHICISSFNIILDLVKQGFGVSFVYNILADSDPALAKFSIRGETVVREFNVVYLKYADMEEKIRLFFG